MDLSRRDFLCALPAGAYLAAELPLPNSGSNSVFGVTQNLDDDQWTGRLDHEFTSRNRLTARYFYDMNRFQRPFNAPPGFWAANDFRNQSIMERDTHIFSSNFRYTAGATFGKLQTALDPSVFQFGLRLLF